MSDLIPFHMQKEIMKRLPVKSLIQFRSVSKAWKSLIDNSEFIAAHSLHRHTQQQHLLVSYQDRQHEEKYVCYIDDDTFPQQRSFVTLPRYDNVGFYVVSGSSHGLLGLLKPSSKYEHGLAVLWNPSIRKSIPVALPCGETSIGFGVCPVTSDPKIVAVTRYWDKSIIETSYQCEAMVYALSSGNWRNLSTNLPTKPIEGTRCTMVTDRFIYWSSGWSGTNVIISFDVTNESFEAINLPNSFANRDMYFSKLRESFVIVEYSEYSGNNCTVWMLEQGVEKYFTKLFTIKLPHDYVHGFRKSGIPIMQVTDADSDDSDYNDEPSKLIVCEPNSEHINVFDICDGSFTFSVNSYMETLLLLDRSDCNSH